MATIVSTRINRIQAVSPRTATVSVGLGTVVDYSDVLNTPALGALAAKDEITAADIVGGLSASNITGLGALALLNTVNASTQVTNLGSLAYANSIAANNIGAGTLAAGVVYAGTINAAQVNAGTLTGVSLNAGSGAFTVNGATGVATAKDFLGYTCVMSNAGQTWSPALYASSGGAGAAAEFVGGTGHALVVTGKSTFQNLARFYGNVQVDGTLTATVSYATSSNTAHRLDHAGDIVINNGNYNTRLQAADGNLVTYTGSGTSSSIWSAHYGWTSDKKYKERIVDTSALGMSVIDSLRVRDFFWKEDFPLSDGKAHTGFIAQELRDCIPSAVGDVSGTLMIDISAVVPFLVKAVQELAARVATLESK